MCALISPRKVYLAVAVHILLSHHTHTGWIGAEQGQKQSYWRRLTYTELWMNLQFSSCIARLREKWDKVMMTALCSRLSWALCLPCWIYSGNTHFVYQSNTLQCDLSKNFHSIWKLSYLFHINVFNRNSKVIPFLKNL